MKNLQDLKHVWRDVPGFNAKICVLDQGAVINAEAGAMLCALESRSTGGIQHHLDVLAEKGPENFMGRFYVGYGHKSIGDNGSAYVFLEGISMLAAKAVQYWRLYNGQESSTRYIDFQNQEMISPLGSSAATSILEAWRNFYLQGVAALPPILQDRYPMEEGEDIKDYQKAIRARSFDIMRAFLPAGTATNVAWFMELRQFTDELLVLRNHPLPEVRAIAEATEDALKEMFPSSFSGKRYQGTENYYDGMASLYTYFTANPGYPDFVYSDRCIDWSLLENYGPALSGMGRGSKVELPQEISECGTVRCDFKLDFGSFRDIQRHRAPLSVRMPLVTTDHGFEPWYLDQLSEDLRQVAKGFLEEQTRDTRLLEATPEITQYYTAMGFNLPCRVVGDLRAMVYLAERRANRDVHPTLCKRAVQMAESLQQSFGQYGLTLLLDDEPHRFDVRRGRQDIVIKE